MSVAKLNIVIVTAQRTLLEEIGIMRCKVTTDLGQLGVEPGHAQLLAKLKTGILEYTDLEGKKHEFFINGGIVEVQPNKVTILADEGLRSDELDAEAIAAAEKLANEQVVSATKPVDRSAALAQLAALSIQKQLLKRRGL